MIYSALRRPASNISRFLRSFSAYYTFSLIFFSSVTLTNFLDSSSRVSAITSPCKASYIAFLNLSSCYLIKIYSASFYGRLGILATMSNYSMRASLFSFPSYMTFCWALPLKILCKNSTATYLLILSLVELDYF